MNIQKIFGQRAERYHAEAQKIAARTRTTAPLDQMDPECEVKIAQQDARDLYVKAGDSFKLAKNWEAAAQAYTDAAFASEVLGDRPIAAVQYREAGTLHQNGNFTMAIKCWKKSILLYRALGMRNSAAHVYTDIAKLCDVHGDLQEMFKSYEEAMHLYRQGKSGFAANECCMLIAKNAGLLNSFGDAINLFKVVVSVDLRSGKVLRHTIDACFSALLCHLCSETFPPFDRHGVEYMDFYLEMYPDFEKTQHYNFVSDLIHHAKTNNAAQIRVKVENYIALPEVLNEWHVRMLKKWLKFMENYIEATESK